MAKDETSIMINLGDEKAKQISEVIGSKSCNRILNLLAEKDLTVSEISRELKMPINTVDYNVKKLVRAGLIEKASHWWSVKGKKMLTYKVSNKKIIISPRKSVAKVFAWTLGLTGLTALTIRELLGRAQYAAAPVMDMAKGNALMAEATTSSAPIILEGAESGGAGFLSFLAGISPWSWFLIGAWFAVFLFFAITLINDGRHKLL
ncbi:MAG: winged helix-turn-helix domain-containing protein [Nanoarchaeota archaeon]|nr:winged helix-turn-helix domain-containing protein [Nanoarchaeota archaeon]